MYKVLWNVGVLATGATGAIGGFHAFQNFHRKSVLAESAIVDNDVVNHGVSDLDLELKQVQVFFRHGARTPLHVLEGFHQASYDVDLVMRPHPFTLFPYERISSSTGLPIDWSEYESKLRRKNRLSGGSIPGHLTGYGQEQMYGLGLRIQEAYGKKLGLSTFDPEHFYVLSTNITRTVESARCVIAGIYGNDQLQDYASQHGPLPLLVTARFNNILVPDTVACSILRQVNHAAMLHFDFIASMKADREVLEKHIDEEHDLHQEELVKAQDRLKAALESYDKNMESLKSSTNSTTSSIGYTEDRRPCSYDQSLYESIRDRKEVVDKVNHFWHNVIAHHPTLGKLIPKDELKALMHLHNLDVEEFQMKFASGYRFKFHFDANPYFHNKEICKEIRRRPDGSLVSSWVTDIKWKTGKQFDKLEAPGAEEDSKEVSFFSWLADKSTGNSDAISQGLRESWRNPLSFYQHVSYKMDHSTTKKINFVFLFDDMKARLTHGWDFPKGLADFFPTTVKNATRMMFYAMTGRHERERLVVTSLAVGRLLLDMVDRAEGVMKKTNPQRICLYSSHDSTMVSLLESLGLWRDVWPRFGADLRLEIYEDKKTSEFYVKVLLLGEAVKLRGQDKELIRWEDFRQVVGPYLLNQEKFDTICASNFLEQVAKDVLEHEEGEVPEAKKSKSISETPAGM